MREISIKEVDNGIIVDYRNYGNSNGLKDTTEVIEGVSIDACSKYFQELKGAKIFNPIPSNKEMLKKMKQMNFTIV